MSASRPASGHGLHSGEEAGSPKLTMSPEVVAGFALLLGRVGLTDPRASWGTR